MRTTTCVIAACATLWLIDAARAHAHGGPPSALGIVAADEDGGPSLVLLNEGLALERDERWMFLCPRSWGDAELAAGKLPLAASTDGRDSWVIGADDLYLVRAGEVTPQARPDASRATIVALAGLGERLYGLRVASDGSEVVRIDEAAQAPLSASTEHWAWIAADALGERLYLSRAESEGEIVVLTLDAEGREIEQWSVQSGGAVAQLRLRPTDRGLYAVIFDGQQHTLARLEAAGMQPVLQSAGPIAGPQAGPDGRLWIAHDGELLRQGDDGFDPVGEPRRVTCLERWGDSAYACAGTELYRLGDQGLQQLLFDLVGLSQPDPARLPEQAARECELQWLLYRNDLERSGLAPQDWTEPEAAEVADAGAVPDASVGGARDPGAAGSIARPSSGCSATRAAARGTPLACLWLACLAWLARARSQPPRARSTSTRPRSSTNLGTLPP